MEQFEFVLDQREIGGQSIAQNFGWVRRVDETTYMVHSQRLDREYSVNQTETGWICDCPDSSFRLVKCKHVWAVEISWTLRQRVEQSVVIQPVNVAECLFCRSENIKKFGVRKTRAGGIRRFLCADCRRTFSVNLGFEQMRASPRAITGAMQLCFTGESLRNVQKFLRLQGLNVSHVAIFKWIRKYVGLMERHLSQITSQLSDTWRADELYVKVKGDTKYLFAMMDDQTRFWIASQVSDTKFTSDVRPLFAEGRKVAGKGSLTLITDGGHHFFEPFKQEFYTLKYPRTKYIRDIRFDGTVHNNKMERMNEEIRDREKVTRGLKRADTPILKGYQLFHNYIRPHEALQGQTPADRCGIKVEGENKWLTLIQNAKRGEQEKQQI
jgi:transposase-like protein